MVIIFVYDDNRSNKGNYNSHPGYLYTVNSDGNNTVRLI